MIVKLISTITSRDKWDFKVSLKRYYVYIKHVIKIQRHSHLNLVVPSKFIYYSSYNVSRMIYFHAISVYSEFVF